MGTEDLQMEKERKKERRGEKERKRAFFQLFGSHQWRWRSMAFIPFLVHSLFKFKQLLCSNWKKKWREETTMSWAQRSALKGSSFFEPYEMFSWASKRLQQLKLNGMISIKAAQSRTPEHRSIFDSRRWIGEGRGVVRSSCDRPKWSVVIRIYLVISIVSK